MQNKIRRNKPQKPTLEGLLYTLARNRAYFNDDRNWGGSEEAQEKESIQNHINWIVNYLKKEYNYEA